MATNFRQFHFPRRIATDQNLIRDGEIATLLITVTAVLLFFVVVPGYLLHYYIGFDARLIYLGSTLICLVIIVLTGARRFILRAPILYAVLLFVGLLGSMVSGATSQFLLIGSLVCSIVIATAFWPYLVSPKGVAQINYVAFIILSLGVIGFIYHCLGGGVTDTVYLYQEQIARRSDVYLTSIGHERGSFIRPASIFDEPGAFSFFIILIVCFNLALGIREKSSSVFMLLGLLTGALAHFIMTLVYFLFSLFSTSNFKERLVIITVLIFVIGVLLTTQEISSFYDDMYGDRLVVREGRLSGDNRTENMLIALDYVNIELVLRGGMAIDKENHDYHADVAANPLSPLFAYGIFIWMIYFAFELWLLTYALFANKQVRFSALALFLILLQRPYLFNFYWGVPILLVAYTIYRVAKHKSINGLVDVASDRWNS